MIAYISKFPDIQPHLPFLLGSNIPPFDTLLYSCAGISFSTFAAISLSNVGLYVSHSNCVTTAFDINVMPASLNNLGDSISFL